MGRLRWRAALRPYRDINEIITRKKLEQWAVWKQTKAQLIENMHASYRAHNMWSKKSPYIRLKKRWLLLKTGWILYEDVAILQITAQLHVSFSYLISHIVCIVWLKKKKGRQLNRSRSERQRNAAEQNNKVQHCSSLAWLQVRCFSARGNLKSSSRERPSSVLWQMTFR